MLYQFLKIEDLNTEKSGLPDGLKDILIRSLCSYTMVPRMLAYELSAMNVPDRIQKLVTGGYLEFQDTNGINKNDLKDFFLKREKKLKELIINLWKI